MTKSERFDFIRVSLAEGKTLREIGGKLGVSGERVRQIAALCGWKKEPRPRKPPKPYVKKGPRPLQFYRDIREVCIAAGLPDPFRKYQQHAQCAKQRGIAFLLTFEEWWVLWEPHYAQRGRTRGLKVMCRYHDKGDYAVGNVRIDFNRANAQERVLVRQIENPRYWGKRMSARNVVVMDDLMNIANRNQEKAERDERDSATL